MTRGGGGKVPIRNFIIFFRRLDRHETKSKQTRISPKKVNPGWGKTE